MKKGILLNAFSAFLQTGIITILQFLTYRYLLDELGIEKLGLWSLIIATTSIASVGNFGFNSGVVKFVSEYYNNKNYIELGKVIMTSFLFNIIITFLLLFLFYLLSDFILSFALSETQLSIGLSLFPLALLNFSISNVALMVWSVSEGLQKFKIRLVIFVLGQISMLILCFIFVPLYGLKGTLFAQLFQSLILLIGALFSMIYSLKMPYNLFRFDILTFKKLFKYGLSYQAIGWIMIFFDPVTKFFLSRYAGLATTGYYELANKLVVQLRTLITSASQTLIPVFSSIKNLDEIRTKYITVFKANAFFTIPIMTLLIATLPLISILWLGYYNAEFVIFGIILSIGWMFNMLCAPAYFVNLGIGKLKDNLIQHIIYSLLNITILSIAGFFLTNVLKYLSVGIALIFGSLFLIQAFHKNLSISQIQLDIRSHESIRLITMFGFSFFPFLFAMYFYNYIALVTIIVIMFLVLLSFNMLKLIFNDFIKLKI